MRALSPRERVAEGRVRARVTTPRHSSPHPSAFGAPPSPEGRGLILALLFFAFALDCSAQSLADIARKERERQKTVQSKIVVTGGAATTVAGTSSTSAAPAPTPPVKPPELTDKQGHDEKYWRAAFQKARDDVKRAETRVELLDLKVKELNTQLLRQSDIYNRENRLGPEITAAQKELEDTRKEAAQAKQKIPDLEDELRRSGGLAGWAR